MQVTVNTIRLPSIIVDAYLDMLKQSLKPILAEDTMPAKAQYKLVEHAQYACLKSVCLKFMPELEEAGLFKDVISIDYPGFKWNRGSKFCYAVDSILPCIVKTIAEEMLTGRDITDFCDFLDAWAVLRVEWKASEMMEDVDGPMARRIEEHVVGLTRVNAQLMVGETPSVILQLLTNIKNAMANGSDTPLDTLEYDMEYLVPNVVTYL